MLESLAAEVAKVPRLSRRVEDLEVAGITLVTLVDDEERDMFTFTAAKGSVDFAFGGRLFDL